MQTQSNKSSRVPISRSGALPQIKFRWGSSVDGKESFEVRSGCRGTDYATIQRVSQARMCCWQEKPRLCSPMALLPVPLRKRNEVCNRWHRRTTWTIRNGPNGRFAELQELGARSCFLCGRKKKFFSTGAWAGRQRAATPRQARLQTPPDGGVPLMAGQGLAESSRSTDLLVRTEGNDGRIATFGNAKSLRLTPCSIQYAVKAICRSCGRSTGAQPNEFNRCRRRARPQALGSLKLDADLHRCFSSRLTAMKPKAGTRCDDMANLASQSEPGFYL